jgi:DNA topoisomerase-3
MRLWIAEKPSLGREIAAQLPGPRTRREGAIECDGGKQTVTWCFGHLLEQVPPEAYNPEWKSWRLDHLPLIPPRWQLQPRSEARAQLATIRKLLASATDVVHAGDPDREGQLLVDEVLAHFGNRKSVLRCLLNATDATSVRRAIAALEPNAKYADLSASALARQRADWLVGMSATRAATITGRKHGYSEVLSIGRVQTPTLALVVARDLEIEAFVAVDHFGVVARVAHANGEFAATWKPIEGVVALDPEGRVLDRQIAEAIAAKVRGSDGRVARYERATKSEAAPLPHSLATLQIEASKRYGLRAKTVQDAAQALYEVHRLTTYPRSDCRHLPVSQLVDAPAVLAAIATVDTSLAQLVQGADANVRSAAWNDAKVTAHHAIVPTTATTKLSALTDVELKVYGLVCLAYIAQFYGAHRYEAVSADLEIASEPFVATGRKELAPGWRVVYAALATNATKAKKKDDDDDSSDGAQKVPIMQVDDALQCVDAGVKEKKTKAPERFTEASLIEAMMRIDRFVADPAMKTRLKDCEGIGTPATRAAIIEVLKTRGFITAEGRHIVSTLRARAFISALPASLRQPDMTARWEDGLTKVAKGELSCDRFVAGAVTLLRQLITEICTTKMPPPPAMISPPKKTHGRSTARVKRQRTSTTRRKRPA